MKIYLVTDWEFKFNSIYTSKREIYERVFNWDEDEVDDNGNYCGPVNIDKIMEEISWDELLNRYDSDNGGEITIEEYNVN